MNVWTICDRNAKFRIPRGSPVPRYLTIKGYKSYLEDEKPYLISLFLVWQKRKDTGLPNLR